MRLVQEVMRLLGQLTREDIEAMPPAERERLAQLLRHVAGFAADPPAPGVLRSLDREPRDN
jgi:hypothetical protein